MEIFVWWLILSIVVAVAAGARGRSGLGWWLLSMVISPLLSLILLALMPVVRDGASDGRVRESASMPVVDNTRVCPFCAESIKREAIKCRFCGSAVEPVPAVAARPSRVAEVAGSAFNVGRDLGQLYRRIGPKALAAWAVGILLFMCIASIVNGVITKNL